MYLQVTEIKERFESSNVETLSKIKVTTIDSFQVRQTCFYFVFTSQKNAAPQTYCLHCCPRSFAFVSFIFVHQLCLLHQEGAAQPHSRDAAFCLFAWEVVDLQMADKNNYQYEGSCCSVFFC